MAVQAEIEAREFPEDLLGKEIKVGVESLCSALPRDPSRGGIPSTFAVGRGPASRRQRGGC